MKYIFEFFKLFYLSILIYKNDKPLNLINKNKIKIILLKKISVEQDFKILKLIRIITSKCFLRWTCYTSSLTKLYVVRQKKDENHNLDFQIFKDNNEIKGHVGGDYKVEG